MGQALTFISPLDITAGGESAALILVSRIEAKESGLTFYCDGKECRRGHRDLRYTKSGACVLCVKLLGVERRRRDPNEAREYKARKRLENPGAHAAAAKSYRARNKEKVRERERLYRLNNPDVYRQKFAKRKSRKLGAGGTHTVNDIAEIIARQKFLCACCGISVIRSDDRHLDHIIPLSRGGRNDKGNLQILCVACNLSKGSKPPEVFMRSRGFLL